MKGKGGKDKNKSSKGSKISKNKDSKSKKQIVPKICKKLDFRSHFYDVGPSKSSVKGDTSIFGTQKRGSKRDRELHLDGELCEPNAIEI
jgi:hypothetical protein